MILVKKLKFVHLLFLSKIDREKLFGDVLDKRKPLETIKISVYHYCKIRIFANGLVHGFGQKFEISSKSIWRRFYNPLSLPVTSCNPL